MVNWTKSELAELERKTRKLLTSHGGLPPRPRIRNLYLPRGESGGGLIISVEDTAEKSI